MKNKVLISISDILILNFNSILFFSLLSSVLMPKFSKLIIGLIIIPFAFLYLLEIYSLKKIFKETSKNFGVISNLLLSSAIILLNFSIFFILNLNQDFKNSMIIFLIEWFLFSYISKNSENEKFFKIISYIFLFFVLFDYIFLLRFNSGLNSATLDLILEAFIPIIFFVLNRLKINEKLNGFGLLISIFFFIYSFEKYLLFFIKDKIVGEIILSALWLIYTLTTLKFVSNNNKDKNNENSKNKKENNEKIGKDNKIKNLMLFLLGITILKIGIIDLTFLIGIYRIIGFIIFGIILLIGAYIIKNET